MKNYDIDTFLEMTGLTLQESDIKSYERAERRAQKFIENELGWDFNYKSNYTEFGKTNDECICPAELSEIPEASLLSPDSVNGEVKLFMFDKKLSSIPIDPANAIYSTKLVVPLSADNNRYITVKTLTNVMNHPMAKPKDIIKYVERCDTWPYGDCGCSCVNCTMLAVDADWLNSIPLDMQDILTEIILFFMKHPYSLETNATIKSESVDGHSVSYENTESIDNIIASSQYKRLIEKYKGPYSPYYTKVRLY